MTLSPFGDPPPPKQAKRGTFVVWKKSVSRNKCVFATKQRMFRVLAITLHSSLVCIVHSAAFSWKGARSSGSRWTPNVSKSCAEGGDQAFWGRRCFSCWQTSFTFINLGNFSTRCSTCSQDMWFDLGVKRDQMWSGIQLSQRLQMPRSWSSSPLPESAW